MNRLRPRTTVLGGAAIGLIVGVAAYGAISSSSAVTITPVAINPASVSAVSSPAPAAPCGAGQTLEKGVCIVHVKRVVKDDKVVVGQAPVVRAAEDRSGPRREEQVGDRDQDESERSDDKGGDRDDHQDDD